MSGLGAWSYGYYHKGMIVVDDRQSAGLFAFKQATIDNGFSNKIVLNATFGANFEKQVISFQKSKGINADGVIGPVTARYLFHLYSYRAEREKGIPDHLLTKIIAQESGSDPVAQGYIDPEDEGCAQINLKSHPTITKMDAWKPSFAINWAGNYLKTFYNSEIQDWDGAIGSYNAGYFYAYEWVISGKPASGKIVNNQDIYTRITRYVAGVKSQGS